MQDIMLNCDSCDISAGDMNLRASRSYYDHIIMDGARVAEI